MRHVSFFSVLIMLALLTSNCSESKYKVKKVTDSNGLTYETVTGDPIAVRIYTLKNGLKVYLSDMKETPRIQTLIAVKAGSLVEPLQTTGLAHYFEHMMFKGTGKIGTTDWTKENELLGKISDLFEKRRMTNDSLEKVKIFAEIDKLSIEASKYAIPNEYDKLMNTIGGQGTNAFTTYQGTIYTEDIPANEVERWLKIEQERFSQIALRLFDTELETVYEEFNMSQDRDGSKLYKALMSGLFNKHPLGRDVIGNPKHLKNPSMVNIHNFFDTYYVPDNMAIIMSGDMDMDKVIVMIDKTFGQFQSKPVIKPVWQKEDPISKPVIKDVFGPDAEQMYLAFRFKGDSTEDKKYVTLINYILSNYAAGLIDLDLVQQQKVLSAGSFTNFFEDYGMHGFYAQPREGQKMEDVTKLLLGEIEKIKKGEFEDWLIDAIIKDLKLQTIRNDEYYQNRAFDILNSVLNESKWREQVAFNDELSKISKQQVMDFANKNYNENYVVAYKRKGVDNNIVKIPKPKITPVDINRIDKSDFLKEISQIKSEPLKPEFIDFQKAMQQKEVKPGMEFFYIPNTTNDLFELNYIIDIGKSHNKKLSLGVNYLPYVGTDKYTPAQLQQEFFKLGLRFSVYTSDERSYVSLSGLNNSMGKGVELLNHLLTHAKGDTASYGKYVDGVLKERANNKLNKNYILQAALTSYGKYGKFSPFTDILQETEMRKADPGELTSLIKDLLAYRQRILYYGKSDLNEALALINAKHILPEIPMDLPQKTAYPEADFKSKEVYFIDYDMVQTNFVWIDKNAIFDPQNMPVISLFNTYYPNIVFQEIREAQGLAYSAYGWINIPSKKDRSCFTQSFVATQSDKLREGTSSVISLMNNFKEDKIQFDLAKESIRKSIDAERITKTDIFWTYLNNYDRGISGDNRKEIYDKVPKITFADVKQFVDKQKSGNYTLLVIGKKGMVDENVLRKLGNYKEMSLKEVFNY